MQPYDAVFLAVAVGLLFTRPRFWWLAALAPVVALMAYWLPLGRFTSPVAATAACLLVPRYAPVALVLAIPVYEGQLDVLRSAVLWLTVSLLMDGLADRIVDEAHSSRARQMSAQFLSVVVLYYTLLPVRFL